MAPCRPVFAVLPSGLLAVSPRLAVPRLVSARFASFVDGRFAFAVAPRPASVRPDALADPRSPAVIGVVPLFWIDDRRFEVSCENDAGFAAGVERVKKC